MNITEKEKLRTWIEIDRKAISANYKSSRKFLGKDILLMSVVKSNAYGHSLVDFSMEMQKNGIDWLGVDSVVEALALRKSKIKVPILVLGYTLPSRLLEAKNKKISVTVSDFAGLKALHSLKISRLNIHIKIDTGMHRQGFYLEEVPKVIKILKSLPKINVEGIYTHFSSAKNPTDKSATLEQISKFNQAIALFENAGYLNLLKHAGATGGSLVYPESLFNMARIGIGMYGLWPSQEAENFYSDKLKLSPVLSWKTIISQIKIVRKGGYVGYDQTEQMKRDTKIAILPVGYWHGFPRALSGVGEVMIKDKLAKVLGRVSMDMIVVDVTDIKNAKVHDEVLLLGGKGSYRISPEDMAGKAYSSSYELITRLNPLIKRIVV